MWASLPNSDTLRKDATSFSSPPMAGVQPGSSVPRSSRNGEVPAMPASAEAVAAQMLSAASDAVAASARREGRAHLVTLLMDVSPFVGWMNPGTKEKAVRAPSGYLRMG